MKKTVSVLLLLCCLLAFCACEGTTPDMSSANKIVYGEKYIRAEDASAPADQQVYYIFEKDHLIRHYYDTSSNDRVYHYTLTYKYTFVDEGTVAYFFDSRVIHDDDNATSNNSNIVNGILLFSENVLSNRSGDLYVRQSYLEQELTNFGK